MVGISQAELDKTLAGTREHPVPPSSQPEEGTGGFRKFAALRGKEFSGPSPCAITQDELDRLLGGKNP
jgi:hypothetical protein